MFLQQHIVCSLLNPVREVVLMTLQSSVTVRSWQRFVTMAQRLLVMKDFSQGKMAMET